MSYKYVSLVYCVCCNKLVSRDDASFVFKTGFFKVVYPLATCHACTAYPPEELAAVSEEHLHC